MDVEVKFDSIVTTAHVLVQKAFQTTRSALFRQRGEFLSHFSLVDITSNIELKDLRHLGVAYGYRYLGETASTTASFIFKAITHGQYLLLKCIVYKIILTFSKI